MVDHLVTFPASLQLSVKQYKDTITDYDVDITELEEAQQYLATVVSGIFTVSNNLIDYGIDVP